MRTRLAACVAAVVAALILCPTAPAATTIRSVGVVSNDIGYDPAHNQLYVSVPSSVGAGGNSLRRIDPVAGVAGPSVFVGSEPNKVAISDNGQYAYVGLDGAAAVRRVSLSSLTADLQFPVGSDSFLGLFYVEDMEVMPGNPGTIAISRRNQGFSPRHEGVAIYDDGVKRPTETPGHTGSNVIEFGNSPTALYGYNNETTDFGFRTMAVSASGVTITNSAGGLISGFGPDIEFGGGKIVSTTGRVIDAATHSLLGTVGGSGPVAVDPTGARAFFASGNSINIYDLNTFLPVTSITVPGMSGPTDVLLWGGDGLAVRTSNTVYLINSPGVIPEPSAVSLLVGLPAVLALRRRHGSVGGVV